MNFFVFLFYCVEIMELVNENCRFLKEIYLILKRFTFVLKISNYSDGILFRTLSLSLQTPDPNLTLALNNTGVKRLMSLRAGVKRTNELLGCLHL